MNKKDNIGRLWKSHYISNIISDAAMDSVSIDAFTKKLYLAFRYILNIDRLAFAVFENGLIKAEFAHSASEEVYLKPPFLTLTPFHISKPATP